MDEHEAIAKKVEAAWKKASPVKKKAAMKDATAFIDKEFKFRGEPFTKSQALSWPRKNASFDDGTPITGVPEALQKATAHLAGFIVANIPMNAAAMAELFAILAPVIEPDTNH